MFDFQIKRTFQKIKSRSSNCCSQSSENNYSGPFTLLPTSIVFYERTKKTSWLVFTEVFAIVLFAIKMQIADILNPFCE